MDNVKSRSRVDVAPDQLADFCRRWHVIRFDFFGSVLRDDFRPDSDIDVLVDFAPDANVGLMDLVDMQLELAQLFGREVDLVERKTLTNPFVRREVLRSLENRMRPAEPDLAYLWNIRESAKRVIRHVKGANWENFRTDEMLQDAVAHPLEIIGEASRHISQPTRDAHPEIPWARMIGLRNVLIHQYLTVNLAKIWDIVQLDVPALIEHLEPLIPPEETG